MCDSNDKQSRKWNIVINNPVPKGFTHERIAELLHSMKPLVYYCVADEQGEQHHTHLYVAFSSGVRFSTLKAKFPEAHIEAAKGTSAQNRDYVGKFGKWEDDIKHGTKIPGTFEEWGDLPQERQGRRSDMEFLYSLVKEGASDLEIMEASPRMMLYLDRIQHARQVITAEKYATEFRQLDVTYIWGPTGTGKTRGVMEKYGYSAVCRVTDYEHPFERYNGESVIVFDEFRSSLKITDMLNYLDGYPVTLPCRYTNRQACYNTVYLISNIPLEEQYKNVQFDEPATWKAFLRRIHHVVEYTNEGCNSVTSEEAEEPHQQTFTELTDSDGELPF